MTALCLGLILLLDYFLIELEPSHRLVAVCCSGFGFIGITSINFLGSLENGFLLGSLFFYALCRGVTKRREEEAMEAKLGLENGTATA